MPKISSGVDACTRARPWFIQEQVEQSTRWEVGDLGSILPSA